MSNQNRDSVEQFSVYTRQLQQSRAMKDTCFQLHNCDGGSHKGMMHVLLCMAYISTTSSKTACIALNLQNRLKFWLLMIPRYTAKKTAKLQAKKEVSQECQKMQQTSRLAHAAMNFLFDHLHGPAAYLANGTPKYKLTKGLSGANSLAN